MARGVVERRSGRGGVRHDDLHVDAHAAGAEAQPRLARPTALGGFGDRLANLRMIKCPNGTS